MYLDKSGALRPAGTRRKLILFRSNQPTGHFRGLRREDGKIDPRKEAFCAQIADRSYNYMYVCMYVLCIYICIYIHTYMCFLTYKLQLELELAIYLELELHLEAQEQDKGS